mmetsp:Transcript_6032/g.11438  ORF Transcript_6032/g.11438 Transcript_6032/m.11438 type:complete len:697 (-) Transcript_6032:677-2767(-)
MSLSDNSEAGPSRLEKAWHLNCNIVILVKAGQWDAVEKRLNTKKSPRNKRFKRILSSVRQTDFQLLMEPDGRGRLPIHWACTRGESLKKKALKALIDAQPGSVRHKDSEGSTPLHLLVCGCLRNTEISKLLIQSYPEALSVRDVFGRTPVFHLVHFHLASYINDEDFPARRLIPALENLLSKGTCVDALTLPCGPTDEYESPAEASNVGPSHTFPNLWRAPSMHRTPLYMMWHYAINANTPLWRSGKKAKIHKKKMRVALLFLRCVYLKEVNGSFDFDLRRKNRVLRQLVKQARESKRHFVTPSSDVESVDDGIVKSPQSILSSTSPKEIENDSGTLNTSAREDECDIKSVSVSDDEFTATSPMGLSIWAQTKSARSMLGEDRLGSRRLSLLSRISIPLSEFDEVGVTDDEKQSIPAHATKPFSGHHIVQKSFGIIRSDSASDDSIGDDSHPRNFFLSRRSSFVFQRRNDLVADKFAESKNSSNNNIVKVKQDSKNSIDLSEIEDHSFFEWMSSRKRRSNKQLMEQTKFRLTHATITFHRMLPTLEILDMALKYCPYQLVKREAKTGCIPLHLAIIKNAGYVIIKRLLETNVSTAKIRTPEGQLPLHLALSQKYCDAQTINYIFQAYPDAIKERDPVSLLYPFMIPASLSKKESSKSTLQPRDDETNSNADAEDVKALTQSYELLMLNPHIAEINQ